MVKSQILLFRVVLLQLFAVEAFCQVPVSSYKLVWSDEFEKTGTPDEQKWAYDLGDGCPGVCQWGNNELQYYTSNQNNARVADGLLIIEARKESIAGYNYSSARLVTRGKGDFLYGKIDVKASLPKGIGTWPAIWMLPTDRKYGGWPASGEIDIMEHVGYEPDSVYGTVHTRSFNHGIGTQKSKGLYLADAESAFHIYSIEWDENQIRFLVDGKAYFQFENDKTGFASWPFDQPFHVILNLAVGGNWGGSKGVDETIWPQKMYVDYVRVYRLQP